MKFNFKEKKSLIKIKKICLTKYDFIIIGSGPAAVILSNKLILTSGNIPKILVIEKGDYTEKKYKKIFQENLPIKLNSRVFSVGGTSNNWSNISSYFEKFEMESRWGKKKNNLWPFSHKELINHYKSLNKKYGFGYERLVKKNFKLPFEIRQFTGQNNPVNFKHLLDINKIDLIYNCKINSVNDFTNLSCAYTSKKNIFFRTKKLILCCGGIETVGLILNSLKNKKLTKMKNKNLVGKYFMNHPKFYLGHIKYPKINLIKKMEFINNNNFYSYHGVSLKQRIQKNSNMLNSYIRFERSNSKIIRFLNMLKSPLINNLLQKRNKFTYKIRIFCEMIPNIKNRIQIKKNKLHVNYNLSNADYKTIKFLSSKVINYFSTTPEKEKNIEVSIKFVNKSIEDASHHMGGLIFNHNNKKKNIDKNLKIYGLQNTYVCSSAIFPTSGSVNPTMTIAALANRLGDHLMKKWVIKII